MLHFRQSQLNSPIYKGGNPISLLVDKFDLDPAAISKLGSNENPLPTPDSVKRAVAAAADDLNRLVGTESFSGAETLKGTTSQPIQNLDSSERKALRSM